MHAAVWVIAARTGAGGPTALDRPPLVVGGGADVLRIRSHNALVLAEVYVASHVLRALIGYG